MKKLASLCFSVFFFKSGLLLVSHFLPLPTWLSSPLPVLVLLDGSPLVAGTRGGFFLRPAWACSIRVAAGCGIAARPGCQTCLDCQAAALVGDSRPHSAQSESVTLLLTSLFQIRAKKAGWLKRRSASA